MDPIRRDDIRKPTREHGQRTLQVFGVALEDGIKLVGAGVAVCYVIGLLVVQLYLASIGVADFTLVQTRYAVTGFFALLPLIAAVFLGVSIAAGIMVARHRRRELEQKRLPDTIAIWSLPVMGFVLVVLLILVLAVSDIDWGASYAPWIILLGMPLVMLMGFLGIPTRGLLRSKSGFANVLMATWMFWSFGLLALVYHDFIAHSIFPVVPEQLGGGQPRTIELVLSEDGRRRLVDEQVLIDEPESRPLPMQLLWETDHVLVLRDPDARDDTVIQLDRDMVAAFIVDPPNPPRSPLDAPLPTPTPTFGASPTS